MGFIVIIPFLALAAWSIFALWRWLRRGGFDRRWRRAFAVLASLGTCLGVWSTGFLEYQVANVRLRGFPIPVRLASREKPTDPWVAAPLPAGIRMCGAITNWLAGVAICLAPIAVAAFFKENKLKRDQHGRPLPPA